MKKAVQCYFCQHPYRESLCYHVLYKGNEQVWAMTPPQYVEKVVPVCPKCYESLGYVTHRRKKIVVPEGYKLDKTIQMDLKAGTIIPITANLEGDNNDIR